jgi:hypothetical protein
MITVVRRATIEDYVGFFGTKVLDAGEIVPGWVLYHAGQRAAIAGISYNPDENRWWAYFNMRCSLNLDASLLLIREVRNGVRMIPHDVYVLCDEGNYATAPKLLHTLGFEPTDETNLGLDVWVHRATEGE